LLGLVLLGGEAGISRGDSRGRKAAAMLGQKIEPQPTTGQGSGCVFEQMQVMGGDCRVHRLANLYVAGSSVFPTGGYVNPTLTIVALALRLADLLRAKARA
jgi:choline dehydrogenase-like flavoprotein